MKATFELCNITKKFGSFVANDAISLSFELGKIHAIVGENGAGKSTLMKIVNGLYQPDSGSMRLSDEELLLRNPADAARKGIGMVYQHFMLVPTLTVAENLILGNEMHRYGILDMQSARHKVREVSNVYGFNIDPDIKISELSVGKQQRVEIMKVLFRQSTIIVFDEPSAVLTPSEVQELFVIMRKLRDNGATILFITHKLQEVFTIAETVSVVRKGKLEGSFSIDSITREEVASLMIGRSAQFIRKTPAVRNEIILQAHDVTVLSTQGHVAVDGVSFTLHKGEILGIAGVDGNGQSELAMAIAGLLDYSGSITIDNIELRERSIAAKKKIVAHIPEDRHKHAAITSFTLAENAILGHHQTFARKGIIDVRAVKSFTHTLLSDYDVQADSSTMLFGQLSGGNQQKCVVGRELREDTPVILAVHPTRGVDIGAIEMIHAQLLEKAKEGKAVVLISSEISDVLALSDTIAVMYKGRFNAILSRDDSNEEKLGLAMTGISS